MKTTLEKYLKAKKSLVKDWFLLSTTEQTRYFVEDNKAYTLLPEYLAKCHTEGASSINQVVKHCQNIVKQFNLNGAKFVQLVLNNTVTLIAPELNM